MTNATEYGQDIFNTSCGLLPEHGSHTVSNRFQLSSSLGVHLVPNLNDTEMLPFLERFLGLVLSAFDLPHFRGKNPGLSHVVDHVP